LSTIAGIVLSLAHVLIDALPDVLIEVLLFY
jgi:hypothetical protein